MTPLESKRSRGVPKVSTIVRVSAALKMDPWQLLREATQAACRREG